jgi:hypothetical protein
MKYFVLFFVFVFLFPFGYWSNRVLETFLLEGQTSTIKCHIQLVKTNGVIQLVKTNGVHPNKYNDKKITEKCEDNIVEDIKGVIRIRKSKMNRKHNESGV